jgi:hypothetical protein
VQGEIERLAFWITSLACVLDQLASTMEPLVSQLQGEVVFCEIMIGDPQQPEVQRITPLCGPRCSVLPCLRLPIHHGLPVP